MHNTGVRISTTSGWSIMSPDRHPSTPSQSTDTFDRDTRLRFMRIDEGTGELLRDFWKVVEPALPDLLQSFYDHTTRQPNLAKLIGNDTPRLKSAQGAHWARLFNGRFDYE
jgi:hypothetical protein